MSLPRAACLLLLPLAAPVHAQARFQDMGVLERRLIGALGAGIGEPGGPAAAIDRRLKLAPCPASVAIEPPVLGAVTLRCAALNWRIRVPLQRLGGTAASGIASAVPHGDPVVRRGDPIELIAESDGFTVSTQATADGDGAPGERIRVRPEGKHPPVYAEVVEAGRARLPGF